MLRHGARGRPTQKIDGTKDAKEDAEGIHEDCEDHNHPLQ